MERDFENPERHQSRIALNDYPSSHVAPPQRPKFWGERPLEQRLPRRALSYVERPCVPREVDRPRPGLPSTADETRRPTSAGDNEWCRVSTARQHVLPCHTSR